MGERGGKLFCVAVDILYYILSYYYAIPAAKHEQYSKLAIRGCTSIDTYRKCSNGRRPERERRGKRSPPPTAARLYFRYVFDSAVLIDGSGWQC